MANPSAAVSSDWPDPLHEQSGPDTYWTTVNVGEAMPGVPTPMSWSIFSVGNEVSVPRCYSRLGIMSRKDARPASCIDDRFAAIFYGRAAMNVTRLRSIADLTPGTSGDAMERQLLGSTRDNVLSHSSSRRIPFILARFPIEVAALTARLRRLHRDQHRWWASETSRAQPRASLELLAEALARFDEAMCLHVIGVAVTQALFEQLNRLATAAGDPGLVAQLAAGYGNYEEASMLSDLWKVARETLSVQAFVARHGFHGPEEGELSSTSWREDPQMVRALAARYAARGTEDRVTEQDQRRAQRLAAERTLCAKLPARQRMKARLLLRLAERYLPLREVGKASFVMALDCARFAARRHGQELQRDDALDAAQDVFMFTVPEVLRGLAGVEDVKDVAAQRAAARARYQKMKLPDRWVGMPMPLAETEAPEWAQPGDKIEGVSITRGIVEGFARVATTLDVAEDLEDDEILVCEVTDPSWVALFPLVAGMVVDIGGPLSHAAIVAREMGIPCVVNTKNAVSRIVTGMRIRLDATNGIVEVVDSAHKPAVEAGH